MATSETFVLSLVLTTFFFVATSVGLRVAVVEVEPVNNDTLSAEQRLAQNVGEYVEILKTINNTNLDLVVYPESTLDTGRPVTDAFSYSTYVKYGETPCSATGDEYPEFMKTLSCAAAASNTYLIFNIVEKEVCPPNSTAMNCQNCGHYLYNVDIVFDRNGTTISSYRKHNLFGEYDLDPGPPDLVTFPVDGETFGIFTCFDILFKTPAQDLVENGVKNFVYPSMWFSELPFLTALQTQQMWSQGHDVNFYAAGANNPARGSGGTGIYNGSSGPLIFDIIGTGGSQAFVYPPATPSERTLELQEEEIDILAKEMDGFKLKIDHTETYTSTILDVNRTASEIEVCHQGTEELCCKFSTKISRNSSANSQNSYVYHLVAFSGVRSFSSVYNGGIEICAVLACQDTSLTSCGSRFPNYETIGWPTIFEELTISANFTVDGNRTQYPNSLLSSIRPVNPQETSWTSRSLTFVDLNTSDQKEFVERTFALKRPQNRLMTFAIYGRNFGWDSDPRSVACQKFSIFNVLLCNLIMIVTYLVH